MCYIGSVGAMPMANRNRKYKTTIGIQASRHQSASESTSLSPSSWSPLLFFASSSSPVSVVAFASAGMEADPSKLSNRL